jgi:DNA-binding response OmpR family regulator
MTESLRVLVVDDEERIRFFLREALSRVGHVVSTAASGEEALQELQDTSFDVVLLDLMLGGRIDGQRVLEAIKWRWPGTVVIILTAHGSLESAIAAIQEGVDGYLLKPVRPDEVRQAVLAAVERGQRRAELEAEGGESHLLKRGPFVVDFRRHVATFEDEALDLTPSELKLLTYLMQNAGRPVSPPELVRVVRDYNPEHMREARRIIKWYVHRLRRKVEPDPENPRYIVNVRGVGYMFEE